MSSSRIVRHAPPISTPPFLQRVARLCACRPPRPLISPCSPAQSPPLSLLQRLVLGHRPAVGQSTFCCLRVVEGVSVSTTVPVARLRPVALQGASVPLFPLQAALGRTAGSGKNTTVLIASLRSVALQGVASVPLFPLHERAWSHCREWQGPAGSASVASHRVLQSASAF